MSLRVSTRSGPDPGGARTSDVALCYTRRMKRVPAITVAVAIVVAAGSVVAPAATSAVVQTEIGERPGAPRNVTAEVELGRRIHLRWDRSTDDTGIASYRFYDNGALIWSVPPDGRSASFPVADGIHYLQMDAVDLDRNVSVRTAPIRLEVDTRGPSAPVDVTAEASYISGVTRVLISFTLPTPDDVAICILYRNLEGTNTDRFVPQRDPANAGRWLVVESRAAAGPSWYQLLCADEFGNDSVRSAPAFVDVIEF